MFLNNDKKLEEARELVKKIKNKKQPMLSDFINAINQNFIVLGFIPQQYLKYELCKDIVSKEPFALEFVPKIHRTKELCTIAVQKFGAMIRFVPYNLRTFELKLLAIKNDNYCVQYFCDNDFDTKIVSEMVKIEPLLIEFIPHRFKTFDFCLSVVKKNGLCLEFIGLNEFTDKDQDKDKDIKMYQTIALEAVKNNYEAIKFVPEDYRTDEMCKIILKSGGESCINMVPQTINTCTFRNNLKKIGLVKIALQMSNVNIEKKVDVEKEYLGIDRKIEEIPNEIVLTSLEEKIELYKQKKKDLLMNTQSIDEFNNKREEYIASLANQGK